MKDGAQENRRGRWVAIATGVISISLAIAYLLLVQLLDFRGELRPAPLSEGVGAGLDAGQGGQAVAIAAATASWLLSPGQPG